jgi:hypothetical protein
MNENRASAAMAVKFETVAIQPPGAVAGQSASDLGAFLGTLATLLRETIGRFEQTTDRVSEMVIGHTGRAGPDLVRAIQDFDRLQQELGAVGDVLSRLEISTAGQWPGNPSVPELKVELLGCVKLADVHKRLALHFEPPVPEVVVEAAPEEIEAEF